MRRRRQATGEGREALHVPWMSERGAPANDRSVLIVVITPHRHDVLARDQVEREATDQRVRHERPRRALELGRRRPREALDHPLARQHDAAHATTQPRRDDERERVLRSALGEAREDRALAVQEERRDLGDEHQRHDARVCPRGS